MSEQVIVCCRMSYAGLQPARAHGYLERARTLTQRAEALGATLAAWSAATLAFVWDPESLEEAISFAVSLREGTSGDDDAWACGIAQGEMEPLAPQGQRADLAWGPPLVLAVSLARVARPGEVLVDAGVEALASGALVTVGRRVAKDAGRRVRGSRLDVRQPWKRDVACKVAELADPPFTGQSGVVETMMGMPGMVAVLRADPGLGGTRVLQEIAARVAPAPCVSITPCGLAEPFGALRRALVRNKPRIAPALIAPLELLLAGEGATLEVAAGLLGAVLNANTSERPAAILVDDAADVDGVTLQACARAAGEAPRPVLIIARLDAMVRLPEPLAALPQGVEIELKPLGAREGEALALGTTRGALTEETCRRWARRGGYVPLAILEAIAWSLSTGELAWIDGSAFARRRIGGKGKPRPASYWLVRRAEELSPEERAVLSAIALLGGETTRETLANVLSAFGARLHAEEQIPRLIAARWLREPQAGWLVLPTRSHREAIIELLGDARFRAWHRAVAHTLEQQSGPLGLAEAASHAAKAGDGPWAARLALAAARTAGTLHLEGSAMRLIAFARAEDPSCEEEALREVAASTALAAESLDSEPPTLAIGNSIAPISLPVASGTSPLAPPPPLPPVMDEGDRATSIPSSRPGDGEQPEAVASRLTELAKQALLGGDAGALERWCNGLRATGEHEQFAERLRAMAHLSHGQIAHAVVALRRARARLKEMNPSPSEWSQASLALAVALAHSGKAEEALLYGLDALARARDGKDRTGERACVSFLAKLFESVDRTDEARQLRALAGQGAAAGVS